MDLGAFWSGMLAAVGFVLVAAIAMLAWQLKRERALAAALAARLERAEARAHDLALLDRRAAALAPLDALWLGWSRGARPDRAALDCAMRALAAARLLYPADCAEEMELAAALMADCLRERQWQEAARDSGRHLDRAGLLEAEVAREDGLRRRIASLRARLVDAARVGDA
jgi:hypothetical protein